MRVRRELLSKPESETVEIEQALGPLIQVREVPPLGARTEDAVDRLDPGERDAVSLATALDEDTLLIMDDQVGRRVARQLDCSVTGIIGALLRAKELGQIEAVTPLLEASSRRAAGCQTRLSSMPASWLTRATQSKSMKRRRPYSPTNSEWSGILTAAVLRKAKPRIGIHGHTQRRGRTPIGSTIFRRTTGRSPIDQDVQAQFWTGSGRGRRGVGPVLCPRTRRRAQGSGSAGGHPRFVLGGHR